MKPDPHRAEGAPSRMLELPTWLISQAYARSSRLLAAGFAAADSRGYHYRLLAAVQEFGPASQADLGRHTGIDRSDVVASLNELADHGFIRRSPDPADGRRNIVSITPAGTKQLRRLDRVVDGVQERLLAPLSDAEGAQLVRLLARLVDERPQQ